MLITCWHAFIVVSKQLVTSLVLMAAVAAPRKIARIAKRAGK